MSLISQSDFFFSIFVFLFGAFCRKTVNRELSWLIASVVIAQSIDVVSFTLGTRILLGVLKQYLHCFSGALLLLSQLC